jgi:hypothetical protein
MCEGEVGGGGARGGLKKSPKQSFFSVLLYVMSIALCVASA